MPFVDSPKPGPDPIGSFVVVALDPVATLAIFNDLEVDRRAREIVTQRRLVIFDFPTIFDLEVRRHRFYAIGSGLPAQAWASIPISPAAEHPEGRTPLPTSKPVPVENPYVHSLFTFEGSVSRVDTNDASEVQLTAKDTLRVSKTQYSDNERWKEQEAAANDDDDDDDESSDSSEANDPGSDSDSESASYLEPHYTMWKCFKEGEIFADPSTLEDELEQLRRIEADWRERTRGDKRANDCRFHEWLRSVSVENQDHDDDDQHGGSVGTVSFAMEQKHPVDAFSVSEDEKKKQASTRMIEASARG
ncbi:hypothetical protein AURDEDRAFT_167732 [Auricularia subglabra TFB-10046 SS5]|nr:hypothetical protein AURDEDRAFT_167732 [Auricularia subglabra TFB-10046 SS5]